MSQLYDDFMKILAYKTGGKYSIRPVNSNFLVDIGLFDVSVHSCNFELGFSYYNNKYNYDCNSSTIIGALSEKENEIFKRVFVKIKDCPKWCQSNLYEIRKNQLAEEERLKEQQRLLEERNLQEIKKQKRLQLVRKIFPFFKK